MTIKIELKYIKFCFLFSLIKNKCALVLFYFKYGARKRVHFCMNYIDKLNACAHKYIMALLFMLYLSNLMLYILKVYIYIYIYM